MTGDSGLSGGTKRPSRRQTTTVESGSDKWRGAASHLPWRTARGMGRRESTATGTALLSPALSSLGGGEGEGTASREGPSFVQRPCLGGRGANPPQQFALWHRKPGRVACHCVSMHSASEGRGGTRLYHSREVHGKACVVWCLRIACTWICSAVLSGLRPALDSSQP